MSFILDALKKSENERQQQATAEFSSVPQGRNTPAAPRWLWLLGLLLAVNVVVVGGLLIRNSASGPALEQPANVVVPSASAPAKANNEDSPAAAQTGSFEEQVALARRNLPPRPAEPTGDVQRATVSAVPNRPPATRSTSPAYSDSGAALPSLDELRADGRLQLPDLHIDLHVWNESPARRFVSINGQKLRENETLEEGPRVNEITLDGVILVHQGTPFIVRK